MALIGEKPAGHQTEAVGRTGNEDARHDMLPLLCLGHEYSGPAPSGSSVVKPGPTREFPRLLAAFTSAYCPGIVLKTDISRSRHDHPSAQLSRRSTPRSSSGWRETAVKVGLRLAAGAGPVPDRAGRRAAARAADRAEAYKAGAGLVTPILSDEEMTLARYRFAPDASFDRAPGWLYEGVGKAFAANTARLAIVGEDPMLLAHEDPAKVARANKANSIAYKPALEKIAGFDINWNIVAYPTASWAKRVFPGETEDVAVGKLAEAIFSASRVDNDDPVAAWADT